MRPESAQPERVTYGNVSYFDFIEEFTQAVVNNPVLEGWDNKIVPINSKIQ